MLSYLLSKYIWGSREQQRQRTALGMLCDEMGLSLVESSGLRPDRAVGKVNEWYLSVNYHQVFIGFGGAQNLTQFAVYYDQPREFNFMIGYGRSVLDPKRRRLSFQTAGSEIENHYYMKTNDESTFRQFLGHTSSRDLLRSKVPVRLLAGEDKGMGHSEFSYHVTSFIYDPEVLKSIVENLLGTVDHMRDIGLAEAASASWLEQNIFDVIKKGEE